MKGKENSGVSGTIESVVLDMVSVPSLVLSVNELSPHGEKKLLRAPEFCFFKYALMNNILRKGCHWPRPWVPTTNSVNCGRDKKVNSWKEMAAIEEITWVECGTGPIN